MQHKQLRVLLLCDLASRPPANPDYSEDLKFEEWESEADVFNVLQKLGHKPKIFGVFDDVLALVRELKENPVDLVFNLAEAFKGDRALESELAGVTSLVGLRMTGAKPFALQLCKDKALSKKIVAFHGVRVPKFEVVKQGQRAQKLKYFPFPALVKPLGLESSSGISQDSFVENEPDCLERVKFIHEKFEHDAIVEEYIAGRELYVGVLGNERPEILAVRELFFESVPEKTPKFASYKAKWDDQYRKRWGIKSGFAQALPSGVEENLNHSCKTIYQALNLSGYARIDLRLSAANEIYFLEANPNPSIARTDDFAQAALKSGYSYEKLIGKIIKLAGV